MNATDLFERTQDKGLPPSSESFWSTVFAIFLLHVSNKTRESSAINTWRCKNPPNPPWYQLKIGKALMIAGLEFGNLSVEPQSLNNIWNDECKEITPQIAGISPDIMIILSSEYGGDRYAIIENKITSYATLNHNQLTTYPKLISILNNCGINCELFLLQSVGCSRRLYEQAKFLEKNIGDRFGIILWEDIIRKMRQTGFTLKRSEVDDWQAYTNAMSQDCKIS